MFNENNNNLNMDIKDNTDFANTFKDFPGGVVYFQFNEKLTIEYFTEGFLGVVGCTIEDFLVGYNNSFKKMIHKDDSQKVIYAITTSMNTGKSNSVECRLVTLKGNFIWVSLNLRIKGTNPSELRVIANVLDINDYKNKEELADMEKEKYKQVLNMNSNISFEYDMESDTIVFNNSQGVLKFVDHKITNFRQKLAVSRKIHKEDRAQILNFDNYVEGKKVEFRFVSVDSTMVWCCVRAVAILDFNKNIKQIIGCIENIDKKKREENRKLEKSRQDSLTHLYNRTFTQKEIIRYLAEEGKDGTHAFMIVDIDNFKSINEKLGETLGDAVLVNISDNLKKIFYEADVVGRVGGDEFLIFIKNSNNVRMLMDKTEDIREIVKNTYIGEDIEINISCSIGITLYPDDGNTFEELFRNADMALYKAKLLGKNRCEFYSRELIDKMGNGGKFYHDYRMGNITGKNINYFEDEISAFAFDIMSRTKDVNSAINLIMDKIGRQFDVSYVNIYEIDNNADMVKVTYLWSKDGVKRREKDKGLFEYYYDENYLSYFNSTEIYCIDDTENSNNEYIREVVEQHEIKSMMQSLIFEDDVVEGFVSIADSAKQRKWTKNEKDSFITVTKVIASYLLKMRASQKMEERLDNLRNFDSLTGLPTLLKFKEDTRAIMQANPDKKYAVVSLDFKKFKYINDTLGYENGDSIIQDFADFIRDEEDASKCSSRVTADNFVLLFEYTDDKSIVDRVVFMSQKFAIKERSKFININLVISSGACRVENSTDDIMVPIDNANLAKKQAKEVNNSCCVFFGDELKEKMQMEFEITNTMETALVHNEFKVYLQPKVSLADGKLVGAEALIRWIKPNGSILPPTKFIPLFEKNGFVVNLDFFVYKEVCKMLREWIDADISIVPISVNVSRVHLYDLRFVDEFTGLIDSYNIPHNLIELELTESIFLDNTEVALGTMKKFREAGFKVSIDDFGAGYSSLNLLKDMNSDVLKLDKEFFRKGELQKEEEIILSSIVNMAKQLNMKVLSEGVETPAQSKFLKEIACDMAQGYLFAKPMPRDSFELIMANNLQFNI